MISLHYDGPVVLAILDGVGLAPAGIGNAVALARTPFLDRVAKEYLHLALSASGEAVGLPRGLMGNSEVGHNTMGSGQIIPQGIKHINAAFSDRTIWQSSAWQGIIRQLVPSSEIKINFVKSSPYPKTLHFAGIFSDGGVHSHIRHLEQMLARAYREGVRRFRIHAIFDGRDVAPQSEPKFIRELQTFAKTLPEADIKIASGCGRMVAVADRYEKDWPMVKRGFDMIVHGLAGQEFSSALTAVKIFRSEQPALQDQYLPAFVVVDKKHQPIGKVNPGDAFIYFDFRSDRAIEITRALTEEKFTKFNRGDFQPDQIYFAGLTEYDANTHAPKHQLIPPVKFKRPLHQFLSQHDISQFAISETAKYGHITYYFNGNTYQPAPHEVFQEIPSLSGPFEAHPAMQTTKITKSVIENLFAYQFLRLNFPGGDMVGHSADLPATIQALEAIDTALAKIAERVDQLGGCLIITADHGNAEAILDQNGHPKTAHTTNPVPLIIYDNTINRQHYTLNAVKRPGLANLAATITILLGLKTYPSLWQPPLIKLKA